MAPTDNAARAAWLALCSAPGVAGLLRDCETYIENGTVDVGAAMLLLARIDAEMGSG